MTSACVRRLTLGVAGSIDIALGIALVMAPGRLLSAVGIDVPKETVFLRLLGVQITALGLISFVGDTTRGRRSAIAGSARLANAGVLVKAGSNGSSLVLVGLGVGDLVAGIAQLLHARSL